MKYYVEVLDPFVEDKVLWHYFLEAPDEETATAAVHKWILEEPWSRPLLESGGMYMLTIEEDTRPDLDTEEK